MGEGEGRVSSDHTLGCGLLERRVRSQAGLLRREPRSGRVLDDSRAARGQHRRRVRRSDRAGQRFAGGQEAARSGLGRRHAARSHARPGVPIDVQPKTRRRSALSLYLHNSCHLQNGTIYSVSGTITFSSLFSGDPNESSSEARLTDATFDAYFADPRELVDARHRCRTRRGDQSRDWQFSLLLPARATVAALSVAPCERPSTSGFARKPRASNCVSPVRTACTLPPSAARAPTAIPPRPTSRSIWSARRAWNSARNSSWSEPRGGQRQLARSHPPTLITTVSRTLREECGVARGTPRLAGAFGRWGLDGALARAFAAREEAGLLAVRARRRSRAARGSRAPSSTAPRRSALRSAWRSRARGLSLTNGGNLQARARDARRAALSVRGEARRRGADRHGAPRRRSRRDRALASVARLWAAWPGGVATAQRAVDSSPVPRAKGGHRCCTCAAMGSALPRILRISERRFLRTRVRFELLPLLEQLSPQIVSHLCAFADALGEGGQAARGSGRADRRARRCALAQSCAT